MVDFSPRPTKNYARTPAVNQTVDKPLDLATCTTRSPGSTTTITNNILTSGVPSGTPALSTRYSRIMSKPTVGNRAYVNRNPTDTRLSNSGMNKNANPLSYGNRLSERYAGSSSPKVLIADKTGNFVSGDILGALAGTGGVLFPYTPTITVTHKASYEMQQLVHTNYVTPMYQHSAVDNIHVSGEFSANTAEEAQYLAAVMWFFSSVTKMYYGQDSNAGTPPPLVFLNGHGTYFFKDVPCVVTNYEMNLPADVDYYTTADGNQRVPTLCTVSVNLTPTYSRNQISNEFSLEQFAAGSGGGFI